LSKLDYWPITWAFLNLKSTNPAFPTWECANLMISTIESTLSTTPSSNMLTHCFISREAICLIDQCGCMAQRLAYNFLIMGWSLVSKRMELFGISQFHFVWQKRKYLICLVLIIKHLLKETYELIAWLNYFTYLRWIMNIDSSIWNLLPSL